jgi:hypothetical protein
MKWVDDLGVINVANEDELNRMLRKWEPGGESDYPCKSRVFTEDENGKMNISDFDPNYKELRAQKFFVVEETYYVYRDADDYEELSTEYFVVYERGYGKDALLFFINGVLNYEEEE